MNLDELRQRYAADNDLLPSARIAAGHVRDLLAEVDGLDAAHTWRGLMALVDEHYPTTIFPVEPDREDRDDGPRILSLLRHLDALAARLARAETVVEAFERKRDDILTLAMHCKMYADGDVYLASTRVLHSLAAMHAHQVTPATAEREGAGDE